MRAVAAFDVDAIMRDVRRAAKLRRPATTATLLQSGPKRSNVANVAASQAEDIEERAGLAADRVPPGYLDAWAQLNHQKPAHVYEAEWRQALDDGGRFLDGWGSEAAEADWTPGELFDVTAGLVWRLAGERVEAIGADQVRFSDGRTIVRGE